MPAHNQGKIVNKSCLSVVQCILLYGCAMCVCKCLPIYNRDYFLADIQSVVFVFIGLTKITLWSASRVHI